MKRKLTIIGFLLVCSISYCSESPKEISQRYAKIITSSNPAQKNRPDFLPKSLMTKEYYQAAKSVINDERIYESGMVFWTTQIIQPFRITKHTPRFCWGYMIRRANYGEDGVFTRKIWVKVVLDGGKWLVDDCTILPNIIRAKREIHQAIRARRFNLVIKSRHIDKYWLFDTSLENALVIYRLEGSSGMSKSVFREVISGEIYLKTTNDYS